MVLVAEPLRRHLTGYDAIARCAADYEAKMAAGDLQVRLGASEDVLRARLALAGCLMDAGWRPDAQTLARIHRDEELLMESNGALDDISDRDFA